MILLFLIIPVYIWCCFFEGDANHTGIQTAGAEQFTCIFGNCNDHLCIQTYQRACLYMKMQTFKFSFNFTVF